MSSVASLGLAEHLDLVDRRVALNYSALPVVAHSAQGAWITDIDGRLYLDCLAAYSAVNFGHANPVLVAAAREQLDRLTMVSRALHHDQMGPFLASLADLVGKEMSLPMNTGAEAVETGIKVARKWGYDVKGVRPDSANIIVMSGNFHGRTTTIIGFSDDDGSRQGFGPFTPGFRTVAYGDAAALAAAIDENTVAVLLEPVQGEAGVIVPAPDYLPAVRALCTQDNVLLIADEIQSGLARTGRTLAVQHANVEADVYLLGKALGGGLVPVSAVVADRAVLGVIGPGQHGSTFGGNPFASAVGSAVVAMLETGEWQQRAQVLGEHLDTRLRPLVGQGVTGVRRIGLWAGVDIDPAIATGKQVSHALAARGVLAKETHGSTIRLAPPLVIEPADIDWGIDQLAGALADLRARA